MTHGSSGSSILRCSITVAAKGADADMEPLVRRYDISDGADKDMMDSAIERTRQTLGQGRRININDVMLLYAGCAYAVASGSRDGGGDGGDGISDGIKSGLPALLADDQVLIGIREITNHVSISVTDTSSGRTTRSTVVDPLRPDPRQARLQQQQQQQQQQQLERRSPK